MEESEQEVIEQTTITLPFLNEEVPALYLADGRPYIPVFAVCHALGIRPNTHIRRWRNLVLWATARKLPFHTERGKRLVWCLLISEVPFLYSLFNWKLVPSERRLQLHRATEEQMKLADQAYQEMQQRYKAMRQALFTFLTTFSDIDALFQQYADVMLPILDDESSLALFALLDQGRSLFQEATAHARTMLHEQGRSLFQEATAHARTMLHEQGALPIVDAVKIDADNNVIDTFSMPLLPIVPHEESERFFALIRQLTSWQQDLRAFWGEQGGGPKKEQAN